MPFFSTGQFRNHGRSNPEILLHRVLVMAIASDVLIVFIFALSAKANTAMAQHLQSSPTDILKLNTGNQGSTMASYSCLICHPSATTHSNPKNNSSIIARTILLRMVSSSCSLSIRKYLIWG